MCVDKCVEKNVFKRFVWFWLSGSVSQLGSAMTGFAMILWAYTQTGSAMAVSLMAFCSYLPYILVSLFAGGFIDGHRKKRIMLTADAAAALGSCAVLALWGFGSLEIWHIYAVNFLLGIMNSFQSPAQSVAVGMLVPKERMAQASGMDSFAGNLVSVAAPVLASAVFAFGGLGLVIVFDLLTFLFAFVVLLVFIPLPENLRKVGNHKNVLSGSAEGFRFLYRDRGLWYIIVTMAVINFFSRLTYENILSPMILARSGNDSFTLGVVNAVIGAGGILGGLIISTGKVKWNSVRMIYLSAAFSFLFGDLMMGLGRNGFWWCAAGAAASVPIPFILAGQRVILYRMIPEKMQGSVFAIRNAIQYSTIPLGILLGGWLADFVLEPFMESGSAFADFLGRLVGRGAGSGMAVMFLCTGLLGSFFSILAFRKREIQEMKKNEESFREPR